MCVATVIEKTTIDHCAQSWRGFTDGVLLVVLFTVSWSKWSVKKTLSSYLRDERIVTIIPTDLVTHSFLSAFYSYLQTKNKNLVFSKLVAW